MMTQAHKIEHVTPRLLPVVASVGMALFAYAGYAAMPNAAGSVAHPEKIIPRAIYLAIGVVTLLYVALGFVVVASVPMSEISRNASTLLAVAARPLLGKTGYIVISATALLATASGINAFIFSEMNILLTMAKTGQLPKVFAQIVWRNGTLGLLLAVAAILLAINFFDLTALASIASAAFVFSHMAIQVAHWQLIKETKGSRFVVGAAFLSMAIVLTLFLWTTAFTHPWSVALFFVFLAGGGMIEVLLARFGTTSRPST
jgi:amino acid transporter